MLNHLLKKHPGIIGHRGAMGYVPENTMASFQKALDLGADLVELDVHMTKDGVPVVIHDVRLERTTTGSGYVKDKSLDAIVQLDAGSWFGSQFARERIPTLEEVLVWAKGRIGLVIEIKNGPIWYDGLEVRIVDLVKRHKMNEEIIITSFDHLTVKKVKEKGEGIKTGIIYVGRLVDTVAAARLARAEAVFPHWSMVDRVVVEECHRSGLSINPWGGRDTLDIKKLRDLGVDGIVVDCPDILKGLRDG
ncbi:MAG: glycerophosphodiester phosphodiesterase [Chloroflexi bacterium]|nr:glycerophosphodiester phosphodiesterase [Chloroflexota bacterium]MCL5074937.1 glycerophosphodiester phosphodiesterase [Chloroflexota bacterium]